MNIYGGDEIFELNGYCIHAFKTAGASVLNVSGQGRRGDVLIVGGGGGGGGRDSGNNNESWGGGGGAGGVLWKRDFQLEAGQIPVVVGDGGGLQSNGDDSSFHSSEYKALGGGSGGDDKYMAGTGGSGGGGGGAWRTGGYGLENGEGASGIQGQGHCGGNGGYSSTPYNAGGGGGAGEPGKSSTQSGGGGDGGKGVYLGYFFGHGVGENGWFGGGGGGSIRGNTEGQQRSIGGKGGGGSGGVHEGSLQTGVDPGLPNTGGGGGGGYRPDVRGSAHEGKPGGSGIVLVRYKLPGPSRVLFDRGFAVHVYDRPGAFAFDLPPANIKELDVLVVGGGGGGGGGRGGGGGGAGGLVYSKGKDVNAIAAYAYAHLHDGPGGEEGEVAGRRKSIITVRVGAGGDGGAFDQDGQNGQDSSFVDLVGVGGGGGGQSISAPGKAGGSGGGARVNSGQPGGESLQVQQEGQQAYGNPGGGESGSTFGGGGGGGAGEAGGEGHTGGFGGNGMIIPISGRSVFYAGGGGGGVDADRFSSSDDADKVRGGLGGGGRGGISNSSDFSKNGQHGEDGKGGGGGGGGFNEGEDEVGGCGGCGTVIIRFRTQPAGGGGGGGMGKSIVPLRLSSGPRVGSMHGAKALRISSSSSSSSSGGAGGVSGIRTEANRFRYLRWTVTRVRDPAVAFEYGDGPLVAPGGFLPIFEDDPDVPRTADGTRPLRAAAPSDLRKGCQRFESPFLSVPPTKEAAAQAQGVNLGSNWFGNSNADDVGFYCEIPRLRLPKDFKGGNHVIFNAGGVSRGSVVAIYHDPNDPGKGPILRFATGAQNHAIVDIEANNIPHFLGHEGVLGWSFEFFKDLSMISIRLFWNGQLLSHAGPIDPGHNNGLNIGNSSNAYLFNSSSSDGINNTLDNNVTLSASGGLFPDAGEQGPLRVWRGRVAPPFVFESLQGRDSVGSPFFSGRLTRKRISSNASSETEEEDLPAVEHLIELVPPRVVAGYTWRTASDVGGTGTQGTLAIQTPRPSTTGFDPVSWTLAGSNDSKAGPWTHLHTVVDYGSATRARGTWQPLFGSAGGSGNWNGSGGSSGAVALAREFAGEGALDRVEGVDLADPSNPRSTPAAAYSTRRLFGAYAGPTMRVRRQADGAMADVWTDRTGRVTFIAPDELIGDEGAEGTDSSSSSSGGGLALLDAWLKSYEGADENSSASEARVQTWYDQSGNGHHASARADLPDEQPYLRRSVDNAALYLAPGDATTASERNGLLPDKPILEGMDGVTYITRVELPKIPVSNGHPFYYWASSNSHISWTNNNTYEQIGFPTRYNADIRDQLKQGKRQLYAVRGSYEKSRTIVYVDGFETALNHSFDDRVGPLLPAIMQASGHTLTLDERYRCYEQIIFKTDVSDETWRQLHEAMGGTYWAVDPRRADGSAPSSSADDTQTTALALLLDLSGNGRHVAVKGGGGGAPYSSVGPSDSAAAFGIGATSRMRAIEVDPTLFLPSSSSSSVGATSSLTGLISSSSSSSGDEGTGEKRARLATEFLNSPHVLEMWFRAPPFDPSDPSSDTGTSSGTGTGPIVALQRGKPSITVEGEEGEGEGEEGGWEMVTGGFAATATGEGAAATQAVQLIGVQGVPAAGIYMLRDGRVFTFSDRGGSVDGVIMSSRTYADGLWHHVARVSLFPSFSFRPFLLMDGEVFGELMADGGDEVYENNGYRVHVFKKSGYFHVKRGGKVEVLIVGGGGGGGAGQGYSPGGGGGGGELYTGTASITTNESVQVTVGAGGTHSNKGEDSRFGDKLVCKGGGAGGGQSSSGSVRDGGSGGGSGRNQGPGGNSTAVLGLGRGGGEAWSSWSTGSWAGAGGGGATEPGQDSADGVGVVGTSDSRAGGSGGEGLSVDISGKAVVYGSGGGGGMKYDRISGSGGNMNGPGGTNAGQGGNRDRDGSLMDGKENTGAGGGGAEAHDTPYYVGGNGGSGIVIVRYPLGANRDVGALDGLGLTGQKKPVAAYALRRLFGTYAGPQVRIRRSSDDKEANVYFDRNGAVTLVKSENGQTSRNLSSWLGGASARAIKWYDQSGNSTHARVKDESVAPLLENESTMMNTYALHFNQNTRGQEMGFGDSNFYERKSYVQIAKEQKTRAVSSRAMLFGSDGPRSTAKAMHNGYRSDTGVYIDHFSTPRPLPGTSRSDWSFDGDNTPANVWAFVINDKDNSFNGKVYNNGIIVAQEINTNEVTMRGGHGEPRIAGSYTGEHKYNGRISDAIIWLDTILNDGLIKEISNKLE